MNVTISSSTFVVPSGVPQYDVKEHVIEDALVFLIVIVMDVFAVIAVVRYCFSPTLKSK